MSAATTGLQDHGRRTKGRASSRLAPEASRLRNRAPADSVAALTLTRRVDALNKWREQFNPLRGLTIRRAVDLGMAYYRGDMADLQWTYFFVEQTDPDLLALLELTLGRIQEMDWNILAPKDAADQTLADEQVAYLRERFDAIDNLEDALDHLALARFRGFAHLEKWRGADGEVNHLEVVDQWNVVRDGLRGAWKYNPDARSTTFRALPEANLMPPEQFLVRAVARPVNRFALLKYVRANLSEKDWDAFVEIFGIPGGVVIGPPGVPTDKATEYEASGTKIAEGGTGYLPNGADWKPNTAARGGQPFKERLDHLTEKLVLAGTGGKLTMLTDATGLGSGASDKHGEVFDIIAAAEARRISKAANTGLVAAWLAADFPGRPALAYFALAAQEETDVSQVILDIKTLADAGYQVAADQVEEKTGYDVELKAAPPVAVPPVNGLPDQGTMQKIGNRRLEIANASADAAGAALFDARALRDLTAAQPAAFAPIIDRVLALDAIADPAAQQAALRQLEADWPDLSRQVLADPALAKALEAVDGTALLNGFLEAAQMHGQGEKRPSAILPPTRKHAAMATQVAISRPDAPQAPLKSN